MTWRSPHILWESCSVRAGFLKALVSSKDRDPRLAPCQDTRATCAKWDSTGGTSEKELESRQDCSCTRTRTHWALAALPFCPTGPGTPSSESLDNYPKLLLSSPFLSSFPNTPSSAGSQSVLFLCGEMAGSLQNTIQSF